MQGYNVVAVFNSEQSQILMCKRAKNPYQGLYNLVGGKIGVNEKGMDAAYRELFEETGLSSHDITLTRLMDFTYYLQDFDLEVYVGKLNQTLAVQGEENELFWIDLSNDFFDMSLFAGEGNIGHILEQVRDAGKHEMSGGVPCGFSETL